MSNIAAMREQLAVVGQCKFVFADPFATVLRQRLHGVVYTSAPTRISRFLGHPIVAKELDLNFSCAAIDHAQGPGRGLGQIDDPAFHKRPAVVDFNLNDFSVT